MKEKARTLKNLLQEKEKTYMLDVADEASLQTIDSSPSYDQTFIRLVVIAIYQNDKDVLSYLFPSDRKSYELRNNENVNLENSPKYVMSPEVHLQIKSLFSRRLRLLKLTDIQYVQRMNKFKKMLTKGLFKIRNDSRK